MQIGVEDTGIAVLLAPLNRTKGSMTSAVALAASGHVAPLLADTVRPLRPANRLAAVLRLGRVDARPPPLFCAGLVVRHRPVPGQSPLLTSRPVLVPAPVVVLASVIRPASVLKRHGVVVAFLVAQDNVGLARR